MIKPPAVAAIRDRKNAGAIKNGMIKVVKVYHILSEWGQGMTIDKLGAPGRKVTNVVCHLSSTAPIIIR
jgi:hypothetical protein